ncbi:MAG: hypothetical protein CVU56_25035 [Deltaproteobacteria bacterium HGW-Deltaproteobacteria-14]|jgi:membrane dipeptidase|nr:MAG: hypothetical protein CVU56_25035 [Deltaproteobacteria bacterium HGW-Deltaproteobacteria-14]
MADASVSEGAALPLRPSDAGALAERCGVSREAAELLITSDVIDLHLDTFIPPRLPLVRYDLFKHHQRVPLRGRFFGHLDLPRVVASGLTGGMWSITTNPFRRRSRRWVVFQKNLARFRAIVAATEDRLRFARSVAEYHAARGAGAHAVFLSIQGGNALDAAPGGLAALGPDQPIVRVTLVHLTNAALGVTSSPLRMWRRRGLSDRGRDFVRMLNEQRVFVDLAHINRAGFWDAVAVHDRTQPLIATHTGVNGVRRIWRNLDDDQIKAIADTGGTVGVIFAQNFLRPRGGARDASLVVDHMARIIDVAGEDFVSIGSDYDGAIVPPAELRDGHGYVRVVQHMLDRGWSDLRVRKILGGNFLRSLALLRP